MKTPKLSSAVKSRCACIGMALGIASIVSAQNDWVPARMLRGTGPLCWDDARGRLVLFQWPTWERIGTRWAARETAVVPSSRFGGALAYDSARRRTVFFSDSFPSETWEYDGRDWARRHPPVSPPNREGHAMAYDAARGCVVLFGGVGSGHLVVADTWEWDGATWTQRHPSRSPPAREAHALAYDAARQRIVLFGGSTLSFSGTFGDTWEWDGTTWTQRHPQSGQPSAAPAGRKNHALAYDAARQCIVLFGGWNPNRGLLADTWEWDGSLWTPCTSVVGPSARIGHGMAYDAARQRVVVVGGDDYTDLYRNPDTWEWDGQGWSLASERPNPAAQSGHALASDTGRQRIVLFGGYSRGLLAETWEWNGSSWAQHHPTTHPSALVDHAMAYDAARARVVLFGGYDGVGPLRDTWEWDGSSWSRRTPSVSPTARNGHALTYDAARRRVVLYGGRDANGVLDDTWEWDGVLWTLRTVTMPPPAREYHAMAYDAARQRVVMFGGYEVSGGRPTGTWEWDGATWTRRFPTTSPPGLAFHAMAYDVRNQRIVLCGGYSSDTWEWDGTNWFLNPLSTLSSADTAAAYDVVRRRVLLFGTESCSIPGCPETYLYTSPATAQVVGTGCAGTNGTPLIASSAPFLGNAAFAIDLLEARASAACLILLGSNSQSLTLGSGCTLYAGGTLVLVPVMTNPSGFATVTFPMPIEPSLRGVVVVAQGVVADPLGAYAGLAFTAGLRLTLGD